MKGVRDVRTWAIKTALQAREDLPPSLAEELGILESRDVWGTWRVRGT